MSYKKYTSQYDKYPTIRYTSTSEEAYSWGGEEVWDTIIKMAKHKEKKFIVIDCYPGVDLSLITTKFAQYHCINVETAMKQTDEIDNLISYNLTNDRVFGILSHFKIPDFYDAKKVEALKNSIHQQVSNDNIVILLGTGAEYISAGIPQEEKLLVYADMPRWEIQMRMRKGMSNWGTLNPDEDMLRKYKRAFFIEWRTADNHKKQIYNVVDFFLDTTDNDNPKLVEGNAMRDALLQVVSQPFRVMPFFDPGVWGGQWMKDVCGLDPKEDNYAWCFDGVPEENSLLIQFGAIRVEIPSINVVFFQPVKLLGDKVHSRFGTEFPIRFDFLDTMGGQHLSLQVHPLVEYIQEQFGIPYTQDESYYILDAEDDACVYLGVKNNINPDAFINALKEAEKGEAPLDDTLYVNSFPAKIHDHFLIPAGTVHCSGKNSLVLEISATPYIFTFKLWDWGRVGLDGRPRPVHIDHGKNVIQWDRDTDWVKKNLINRIESLGSGDGWREEKTGLHEREFIETRRHWFTKQVTHDTGSVTGSVHMLNLVQGEEIIVESPDNKFQSFIVHYAETFIIPAAVGTYTIRPHGPAIGSECATVQAFLRG